MPQNLDELIAQARFNLVDRIARQMVANNPQGIHVHNRVIEVARAAGFGISAINSDDAYLHTGSSNLSDTDISTKVKTGFTNHFQLFALLNALREQIEALIANFGYQGKRELDKAYQQGEYEKFIECINRFIPIKPEDLFETDLTDINWGQVKRAILQTLRQEDYVSLTIEEASLLDGDENNLIPLIPHGYELAQCLEYFSEWRMAEKAALVFTYLKNKSPTESKEVLAILHHEAPQLTAQLKTEPSWQGIYFDIAIAEKEIAAVRTYVEQGADINAALPLLFNEAHKRETLFWLYEHPNLLQQMTAVGLNTVIPEGKYQGKTVAETLVATKKGRQLLSENTVLQTLFSQTTMSNRLPDYLRQAETERSTVNTNVGFFKQPNSLAIQFVQWVVYGDLSQAEALLKANPSLLQTLLTEKVTVTDYSRRKVKQKTAFQAALCAMDDELCGMLANYMTKEEMVRQYQAIFQDGHEAYLKAQTPFDFSQIVDAISKSSIADVQKALDLELPNTTDLWKELEQFRADFTKCSYQESVFNQQHLIKAFQLYDSQRSKWNSDKLDLFWRQVVGFTQRFLPANIAMDFAQGLYARGGNKDKALRSLNFTFDRGSFYPLAFGSFSGLGYEFAAGPWTAHAQATVWFRGRVSNLMSSKNSNLGGIMQSERSGHQPRRCIIL